MSLQWNLCVICQQATSEPLRCPLNAHTFHSDVYSTFLDNVAEFKSLNALPVQLKFDTETTSVDDLVSHQAKWHQSCHLKFSLSKLKKARERGNRVAENDQPSTRPSIKRKASGTDKCIFCDEGDSSGVLHNFSTLEADRNLRVIAAELQDFQLLAKISGGDLIAIEAKYHMKCLTILRNSHRSLKRRNKNTEVLEAEEDDKINESRAFVELVHYMENSVESGTLFFVLSELHMLYETRLKDLGVAKSVNRFRLKNKILGHFTEAQEQNDGRKTILIFNNGLQNILKEAVKERDFSDDAAVLAKAAKIVRRDMFSHKGFNFTGSFPLECQENSVPASLKSLISMTLNGINLKDQEHRESQPCLTICQTILFNTKKRTSSSLRHSAMREPPLPIYIGFNIHSLTRCKTLIAKLYQLGLSVSYDRVMEIEDWLATAVTERYKEDGCVSPACLKKGLFSVGALDNLDHNPSSTTATSSFHGTGISIFQFPTESNPGQSQPPITVPPSGTDRHSLPDSYALVPPTELKTTSTSVPERSLQQVEGSLEEGKSKEKDWVEHALQKLNHDNLESKDAIVWAAYHSSAHLTEKDPPALSALLPLFYEKAATPAMIKHGMDVLKRAIKFLNPIQIPVVALDQPLFALAKMVQWKWPETHGEDKYVVMFGGLHLEMALWSTLGDLLGSSGWTTALIEAEVASPGVADSFLRASHLTRTR